MPESADTTMNVTRMATREHERLAGMHGDVVSWRRWGPYVSERSWGTVREDYSADGCAWDFLPHDLARSTAYRWGEDGLAGICDRRGGARLSACVGRSRHVATARRRA